MADLNKTKRPYTLKSRLLQLYSDTLGFANGTVAKENTLVGSLMRLEHGWLTLPQAMGFLCASDITIRKLARAGRIRTIKPDFGQTVFYSLADCQSLLDDCVPDCEPDVTGCVNDVVPQVKAGKAGRRKKEDPRKE